MASKVFNLNESSFEVNSSKGGVVPFLAVSIAMLVGLAALVIDVTLYTSSHGEIQSTADMAALSALEVFTKAGADGVEDFNLKVEQIRESVAGIIGNSTTIGDRFDGEVSTYNENNLGLYVEGSGSKGEVVPGFWFYEPPSEGCPFDKLNMILKVITAHVMVLTLMYLVLLRLVAVLPL